MEGQLSLFDLFDIIPCTEENSQDKIKAIEEREILKGSGFENGKNRIYSYFKENHSEKECVEFLKKEYGIGGWSIEEGICEHNGNGIDIRFDNLIGKCTEVHIGWPMVAKMVKQLIEENKYVPQVKEIESPAETWARETGFSDYWQHDVIFIDDKPVCKYSEHSCNRKELWKIAESFDDVICPHVCCRNCAERLCGARCNGSEEPKCRIAEECEAYPRGCGGTIDPCRFGGPFKWSNKREKLEDVHIDREGRPEKAPQWMKYKRCENCKRWQRYDIKEQPPAGWGVMGYCIEHKEKCSTGSYCNDFEDKNEVKHEKENQIL